MSVNGTIDRLAEVEAAGLTALMPPFVFRWKNASSQEERLAVEGEAITWFLELMKEDPQVSEIRKGDSPLREELARPYDRFYDLLKMSRGQFQKLTDLYIQYYNTQQLKLLELQGKLRRIQQKRSALTLWDSTSKFVLADRFLNHDWLSTAFTSDAPCNVDTAQGLLTLPVEAEETVTVKAVSIGSGSNGSPGNSNGAVDTTILNPNNVRDGDVTTWFEYERLDVGPCKLALNVELPTSQIVNSLRIQPVNLGSSYNFEIEDVLFTISGGGTQSIKDLVAPGLPDSFWTIQSAGTDSSWTVTFLPVQCQSIVVRFVQRNAYPLEVLTSDRRTATRDRFAIAVKELRFFRQKYSTVGSIGSTERDFLSGLYAALPVVQVHPPRPALFNLNLESSLDGGGTWEASDNIDDGIGSTLLLDGAGGTVMWRLQMQREEDAFSTLTDLLESTTDVKSTSSVLRTVSKFQSPAKIALKEKPLSANVFAMQTKLGRRGDKFASVYLGTGTGTAVGFDLPFSVVEAGLEPEMLHVYVNRKEYTYVEDSTTLGSGEWSLSDDYQQVLFSADLPLGAVVRIAFEEERMNFIERADGYFHKTELLFDPDKENIFIHALPRESKRNTKLLPRDKRIVSLAYKNIEDDSFTISTLGGTALNSVASRTLLAAATDYYMDPVNGIIYFYQESDDEQYRVSFAHQNPERLASNGYDIVYDGLKPSGILIKPSYFEARQVTETVSGSMLKRIDPITGIFGLRANPLSVAANAKALSHDYIVINSVKVSSDFVGSVDAPEEVTYVDGKTEFLGLIPMETEETVETEADANGLVQFTLAGGALWYKTYGVLFEDSATFANKVSSAPTIASPEGDYFVSDGGVVTVKATAGVPGSYGISYYYRDPNYSPENKFSVDYRRGRIYSHADMASGATIEYKVASYKIRYDIAEEIDTYSYDSTSNTVEIRTEGLRDMNALVKVIWEKDEGKKDLRLLRNYFSPLVSLLGYRFN
jgi:hypothetical protein